VRPVTAQSGNVLAYHDHSQMYAKIFYLIEPQPNLLDELEKFTPSAMTRLLGETELWLKGESGKSFYLSSDHLSEAKIVYLCYLRDEYSVYEEYQHILGRLPINEDTFDRFWLIRRFLVSEDFDDVRERLNLTTLERVELPDRPNVKNRFDALISRRKNTK
jgi:hypothetical protein